MKAELEPLPGLYWWHWWGLATRWHGAAADGLARPGPGRGAVVYSGEAGTRKRGSLAPSLPASRAKEQPGRSKAGWGLLGVFWKRTVALCLVLCAKDLPVQADLPQITPGVVVWGGNLTILSQERRNEAFLFNPLFWDMTDASSACCCLRIAGLERSHLQPNPDGAAAELGLRWQSGARWVPVPPPSYIMGSRVVVQLRCSIPIPTAALSMRELKP